MDEQAIAPSTQTLLLRSQLYERMGRSDEAEAVLKPLADRPGRCAIRLADIYGRLTVNLDASRFDWDDHQETWVLRTTTNYQFTRRVGLRLFHERVIERTDDTTQDSFNTVFDYEFTPESHFFFVFVRDRASTNAVFSKIAYLFGED